jgi:plastocyanin
MSRVLAGFVVIVTTLGLAACGDDDDDDGAVATSAGASATTVASGGEQTNAITITVSGNAFDPNTATATAGKVVFNVTNQDSVKHTFTIDGTDVDIALDPNGSGSAEAELDAGTYQWHCKIHPSMTGTLTVT